MKLVVGDVIRLTKIDAARRQLRTAIRMFFEKRDAVSIHTLASAAQELLRDLLKAKGEQGSFIKDNTDLIEPEGLKLWFEAVNRAQNFFKHADLNPNAILDFHLSLVPIALHDSAMMYRKLTGHALREGAVFCLWFSLKYPRFLTPGAYADALKKAKLEGADPEDRAMFLGLLDHPEFWSDAD